jgi:glutamate N-acetyltransferase/amino-acid N-acetyltransferase
MPSTNLVFADRSAHRTWLSSQAALPKGWRVGMHQFGFTAAVTGKPAKMRLTLIVPDAPTPAFAAVFTQNAFPGAPIVVGKKRLNEKSLGAFVINTKISNVCSPTGEQDALAICARTASLLKLNPEQVFPSSTGVIGWSLPVAEMSQALPQAVETLQSASIVPAAEGICTTDLYPKIRRADLMGGSIVGIAKGAGMIEPNLATMLVYILTDLAIPREKLRQMLSAATKESFNRISIDTDQSTSDTVCLASSNLVPCTDEAAFARALMGICQDLAEDVVRNGEGVRHVQRVRVTGAPDSALARAVGKSVVNSPLWQCALAGNDPNVGRLVCAVGKYLGNFHPNLDPRKTKISLGGRVVFSDGAFRLNPETEAHLVKHFVAAELYPQKPAADGITFRPPVDFPPHESCVEIDIDLGLGSAESLVLGCDRTHEYITENADYRS